MTTKYVKYCSYWKASCAKVTSAPVVLCLQDAALIVQFDPPCGLPLTTILATICQAYTLNDGCGNALWNYTFAYDDEQLVSPNTPLIAGDITGFFCQDCLTDWVEQQISCVETGGNNLVTPYYSNVCAGMETDGLELTTLSSISFDSTLFENCGQRIMFKACGTWTAVDPDRVTLSISFGTYSIVAFTFETDTTGQWFAEGYVARGAQNEDTFTCFGFNTNLKVIDGSGNVDYPTFGNHNQGLPLSETLLFQIIGQADSADSSMTLDQLVIDYYDAPITCEDGEIPCCD